ncbi:MAG: hypothetical protein HFI93_07445 [Lachnospiraceae bacterium]|nr:hypothetical protein [Lachnospiraceae bacterium]
MYWEGINRGYVWAVTQASKGKFAGRRAGAWLRRERERDLFTDLEYIEAVDAKGYRARVGLADSQMIFQRERLGQNFQCYYVKEMTYGRLLLVFCAGDERPEDEFEASLFEMPEEECI